MDRSAHYREQAERCTRLAGGGIDPLSRERLLELARENTALADALAEKESDQAA